MLLLKSAFRSLLHQRMSTLINLFGLSVAMASSFLIFIWVQNEYSYDRFYPQAKNIYRLTAFNDQTLSDERIPYKFSEGLKENVPGIISVNRLFPLTVFRPEIAIKDNVFKENGAAYVDANWFTTFPAEFIHGNAQSFKDPNSAVLSISAAKKYFGTADAVGETFLFNGKSVTVAGVTGVPPTNSSFRFDVIINDLAREVRPGIREAMSLADAYQTFIKVSSETDKKTLTENLNHRVPEKSFPGNKVGLVALCDIHFEVGSSSKFIHRGSKKVTMILLLIGIVLLCVACVNYINLATAKVSARLKEVGMKKLVGATSTDLFLQFISETALLIFTASLIALLIAYVSLPVFNSITQNSFTLSLTEPVLWAVLGGTFVIALLLSSIYPAVLMSSFKPLTLLRTNKKLNSGAGILRRSLVIAQFAVAVLMIAGTVVIYCQMNFIKAEYSSQYDSGLFSFSFYTSNPETRELVKQQLLTNSNIAKVSYYSGKNIVDRSNEWSGFDWDGRDKNKLYRLEFSQVGSNLNELTHLKMKRGRWFSSNRQDEKNFILNEEAIAEMGLNGNVVGQRLSLDADTGIIIGIVQNFHYAGLHSRIGPLIIGNNPVNANGFLVQPNSGKESEALAAAATVFNKFAPGSAFDYLFAEDEYENIYRAEQNAMSLVLWFCAVSLLISCLGVYALATFNAGQRTKEVGVRKVLGSTVSSIVTLLSTDFLKLVLISITIAVPLAWWIMGKWLDGFAYRVDLSWWMFAIAGIVVLLLALGTVGFQALKAALASPVRSLRSE